MLARMELPVAQAPPFCVPDAFVGGPGPDRAAEAVAAFLARHRPRA